MDGRPGIGIVALNLQRAARSRLEQQVDWLAAQELGDVLVLSEVGAGERCQALVTLLAARGYAASHDATARAGPQVVIAFRHDGPTVTRAPVTVRGTARFVHTSTAYAAIGFDIVGLYVPSRGPADQRNVAKRAFQHEVSTTLPAITRTMRQTGRGLVVAGDLNVVEPGHTPHQPVFGKWEYDFYDSFTRTCRLNDAFRGHNGDKVDHSWFGKSGRGYRIDHIFVSDLFDISECRYDQTPRHRGLSDHAALMTRLVPTQALSASN